MRINCLNCGHKIELDDVYDDYEGLIKCMTCRTLLSIKTEDSKLKGVGFATNPVASPSATNNFFGEFQQSAMRVDSAEN
jgi:DNA-directed RNA polymerase subunit RPC12/RpoP